MNNRHAFGFVVLGLVLIAVPAFAPGLILSENSLYPQTGNLWLTLMGGINALVGGGWWLRTLSLEVIRPRLTAWRFAWGERRVSSTKAAGLNRAQRRLA